MIYKMAMKHRTLITERGHTVLKAVGECIKNGTQTLDMSSRIEQIKKKKREKNE